MRLFALGYLIVFRRFAELDSAGELSALRGGLSPVRSRIRRAVHFILLFSGSAGSGIITAGGLNKRRSRPLFSKE
jgi:hypothetical protein